MPIYDFFCEECQKEYEIIQSLNEQAPNCEFHPKTQLKKVLSKTFVRRGGGLYSLDTDISTNKEEMK